jgi:hypothetical protein
MLLIQIRIRSVLLGFFRNRLFRLVQNLLALLYIIFYSFVSLPFLNWLGKKQYGTEVRYIFVLYINIPHWLVELKGRKGQILRGGGVLTFFFSSLFLFLTYLYNLQGTSGLEGEFQSGSEVDFYIDRNMIHIADTKVKLAYSSVILSSVVDPPHVDADPDSTYRPDAAPDSDFFLCRSGFLC